MNVSLGLIAASIAFMVVAVSAGGALAIIIHRQSEAGHAVRLQSNKYFMVFCSTAILSITLMAIAQSIRT